MEEFMLQVGCRVFFQGRHLQLWSALMWIQVRGCPWLRWIKDEHSALRPWFPGNHYTHSCSQNSRLGELFTSWSPPTLKGCLTFKKVLASNESQSILEFDNLFRGNDSLMVWIVCKRIFLSKLSRIIKAKLFCSDDPRPHRSRPKATIWIAVRIAQ